MPKPAKKDLEVYQGDDHSWPISITSRINETTSVPYDLTGHSLSSHIRTNVADEDETIDAPMSFQIDDPASGSFIMKLASEDSALLGAGRYKWDLQLTRESDDNISTLLYGSVIVAREVTRP